MAKLLILLLLLAPAAWAQLTGGSSGGSTGATGPAGPTTPSAVVAKSANYTIASGDATKLFTFSATSTITLPQAGTTGFASGQSVFISNIAASGNDTINTTTSTFIGMGYSGSTITLLPAQGVQLTSDGTNWNVLAHSLGGGSGTVTPAAQFSVPYYSTAGTSATLDKITNPPTSNGTYTVQYGVTGGTATAPSLIQDGVVARSVAGTTSTDTIVYGDNNTTVVYGGSVAVAVTLPTATTLGNPGFYTVLDNVTTGTTTAVTVTPTTWTINGASTLVIPQGQFCRIIKDPASSTNWKAPCTDRPATAGTNITITRTATGPVVNSSGGSGGCTSAGASGALQSSDGAGGCADSGISVGADVVSLPHGANADAYGMQGGTQDLTAYPTNSNGLAGPASVTGKHYVQLPTTGATAAGQSLKASGAESSGITISQWVAPATVRIAGVVFDGGGTALTGTLDSCVNVPNAATVTGMTLLADQSGSNITVDPRSVAYGSYTGPSSASSIISGGTTPFLTSTVKYQDTTLTGYSTSVSANAVVCFHLVVSSTTAITWVTAELKGNLN